MNSSFSLRRLGVMSRMSSDRWAVWAGGSMVGSWSDMGSLWRCSAMRSVMSSPSSGTGKPGKGPDTVLQAEKPSLSLYISMASR